MPHFAQMNARLGAGKCFMLKKINGRRDGAKEWQSFFTSVLLSEEARSAGYKVTRCDKYSCLFYVKEIDVVLTLHVDDGHGAGTCA